MVILTSNKRTFKEKTERLNGLPGSLRGKQFTCNAGNSFDAWVRKIPLEKIVTTHSSILAWEIPWTEEPGGLQSKRLQKSWT